MRKAASKIRASSPDGGLSSLELEAHRRGFAAGALFLLATGAMGRALAGTPEGDNTDCLMQPPLADTVSPQARAVLMAQINSPAPDIAMSLEQRRAFAADNQDKISRQQLKKYDVARQDADIAGVPVRIFTPRGASAANSGRTLMNLHGGGFVIDSGSFSESIPMAALTRTQVVSVLYALAPEHPYPKAVDDSVAVYRELISRYAADRVAIYGTSAGAILAAETVARILRDKLPVPGALGYFSGMADFARSGDTARFFLPHGLDKMLERGFAAYVGATPRPDPALSPLYGPLSAFPPTLCVSGTRDFFLSGTSIFHRALLHSGVDAQLLVFEGMPHAHWTYLDCPETDEALASMAGFLTERLGGLAGTGCLANKPSRRSKR